MEPTYKFRITQEDVEVGAMKTVKKAADDEAFKHLKFDDFQRLTLMVMESLLEASKDRKNKRSWLN